VGDGWRRLAVVFAAAAVFDVSAWGQMQAFTPIFLRVELGQTPDAVARWTGVLASSMLVLALPLAPLWGALADRYGRKPVILRGFVVSVVAYLITAFAQNVEQVWFARFLLGLTFGTQAVVVAAQADVTPERRIATTLAFIQMMFPIGQALGPLIGGFLIEVIGVRGLFVLNALQSAVACLLVIWLYREPARPPDRAPIGAKVRATFGRIAAVREVRGVFAAVFFLAAGTSLLDPYVPFFLDQLYGGGDSAAFVGLTMSLFGLLAGGLTLVAGRLADRFGRARVFGWSLLGLGGVAVLMAVAVAPAVASAPMFALLQVVRGIPTAGTVGLAFALIVLYVPAAQRASVLVLVPLPRNVAGFLAPLTGAGLAPLGAPAVCLAAAATYLVAWGVMRWSSPPPTSAEPPPEPEPAGVGQPENTTGSQPQSTTEN